MPTLLCSVACFSPLDPPPVPSSSFFSLVPLLGEAERETLSMPPDHTQKMIQPFRLCITFQYSSDAPSLSFSLNLRIRDLVIPLCVACRKDTCYALDLEVSIDFSPSPTSRCHISSSRRHHCVLFLFKVQQGSISAPPGDSRSPRGKSRFLLSKIT